MENQIKIDINDITFNSDGSVTVSNEELKTKLVELQKSSDLLVIGKNTGNESINITSCSSVNAVCKEIFVSKDDLILTGENELKIKNSKFNSELLKDKIKNPNNNDINIAVKGFKSL